MWTKKTAGRGFLFLASVFELTELPKYHHVAQHYANTSLPVITGVLGRNLFFRVQNRSLLQMHTPATGWRTASSVCFWQEMGEREIRGWSVCADFSAKQMFISISECSCETIRLHYQEHTNYVGARAKRGAHRIVHIYMGTNMSTNKKPWIPTTG